MRLRLWRVVGATARGSDRSYIYDVFARSERQAVRRARKMGGGWVSQIDSVEPYDRAMRP